MNETALKFPGLVTRALSLIIDSIMISAIGAILTYPLSSAFESHPQIAEWLFFLVCLGYFSILDSDLVQARSLGRKILNIKLVAKNNISLHHSFARKFLVLFPFFNGVVGSSPILTNEIIAPISSPIFFGLIGIGVIGIYLTIMFSKSKIGAHDWIFRTRVVYADQEYSEVIPYKPIKAIWAASFLIPAIAVIAVWIKKDDIKKQAPIFSKFEVVQDSIEAKGLGKVYLSSHTFKMTGTDGNYTRYTLVANIKVPSEISIADHKEKVEKTILPILREEFEAENFDGIKVTYNKVKFIGFFPIRKKESYPSPMK